MQYRLVKGENEQMIQIGNMQFFANESFFCIILCTYYVRMRDEVRIEQMCLLIGDDRYGLCATLTFLDA